MELLLKLNKDQVPRLGICYTSEYQAEKAYEVLKEQYGREIFKADFELQHGRLQLTLSPANGGARVYYKGLEFKPEQLKKLQQFVHPDQEMEFVHVFRKHNQWFVAKPRFKKPEFFRISGYQLLTPSNFP